jgi:hypothetical protein
MPQIFSEMAPGDSAEIFAAKREMIDGFYHPENGDILLDYHATDPDHIWNLFDEIKISKDSQKTLNELCDVLFSGHTNAVQPFFTNAAKDVFKTLTMYLADNYERKTGKKPSNGTLIGFFDHLKLEDTQVGGRIQKGLLTLIREVPELNHLSNYIGNGQTAQSLGVLGELRAVLTATFQGGSFVKAGNFTVRGALEKGCKIFLLYDFAESTESGMVFFDMILDQLIKVSLQENNRKNWCIWDEYSLIGHLQFIQQAMAFGRSNGFRMIAAIQSVQLMEKNYSESEASCLLSLFPNIFCFFTSDDKSRELVSRRYGNSLVAITPVGGGKPVLMERKAIQDVDFYKITRPGDCIVSLAGFMPFIFRNHSDSL